MAGVSSLGTGSGIDLNSLVDNLVNAEGEIPRLRLDAEEAKYNAELTGFGNLKSALASFQTTLDSLDSLTEFQTRTATSADSTLFTAIADADAPPGTYDVEVTAFALAQKLKSPAFTGISSIVGSGTITIATDKDANSFTVTISPGTDTVGDIRDAINNASGNTGVTASVITTDNGGSGTQVHLVLTADELGTDNILRVTANDDDLDDTDINGLSQLVYDPVAGGGSGTLNSTEMQAAVDGQIQIDGQTLTNKSGNTYENVIDGVDITTLKADVGNAKKLTIAFDKTGVATKITNFVNGFNMVMNTINDLTSYDKDTGKTGILFSDSTLLTLASQMRRELTDSVTTTAGNLQRLSEIGITIEKTGLLSQDSDKVDGYLNTNFDEVGELFARGTGSVAIDLDAMIDNYTETGGLLQTKTDSLHAAIKRVTDKKVDLEDRLDKLEERLRKKFTSLDALVTQLKSQQNFLTQQFENFAFTAGSKKR